MHKNIKIYNQAVDLRKKNYSYSQISKKLKIPKGTLSSWFSLKNWSKEIKNSLVNSSLKENRKSLILANLARLRIKNERHSGWIKEADLEFRSLKNDLLFLAGISIYWGEGDKANSNRVAVINTDPELLSVIKHFYQKCLRVAQHDFRIGLFLYSDINREEAIKFWSNKLNIPRKQFIKIQVLQSRSTLTKRKSKYGICSLYFCSSKINCKIKHWLKLLGSEICGNSSAVE